jgi:nucleotide-binding universal stress UspA family protein
MEVRSTPLTLMINIKRILCPTDLSAEADHALRYALALTQAYEATLVVCYCAKSYETASALPGGNGTGVPPSYVGYSLSRGRVKDLFEGSLLHFLDPVSFTNLNWEPTIVEGEDVGEAITQTAAEKGIDLIVMRSRRRPNRAAVLGSTAESVCRTAPCPVLVTHNDEREWVADRGGEIVLKRLLVAYDFSDYSELALKYALSLAQEHQAELHLLHVLPPGSVSEPELTWYPVGRESAYHQAARRLQKAIPEDAYLWCDIKHAVAEGHPYREVLNYAEKHDIDLISVGAHGAGFGMRALFGSNVDRVLRQAKCPVLVARPLRPAISTQTEVENAGLLSIQNGVIQHART